MISFFKQNITSGLIFNYLSLAVLAGSGFVINIIITAFYGTSVLGIFNIVYAIYIVFSQLCVMGVHYSVLKNLSTSDRDVASDSIIIISALIVCFFISLIFSGLLAIFHGAIAKIFSSSLIGIGVISITPAIVFFGLNKIFLFSINGFHNMKAFAFFQSLRYLLMMLFVFVVSILHISGDKLFLCFTFTESILFLSMLFYFVINQYLRWFGINFDWVRKHLLFGLKGCMSGILVELNSRVDILILGLFATKHIVGVYSFAALFAEGVSQFTIILKNNINPLIAKYIHNKAYGQLTELLSRMRKMNILIMSFLIILLNIAYPIFIHLFFNHHPELFNKGWLVIAIFSIGLFVGSAFLPFDNIFSQAGMPGLQSIYGLIVVTSNVFLCFVLVSYFGFIGCAFAAMISSYVISSFVVFCFSKRYLFVNLLSHSGVT